MSKKPEPSPGALVASGPKALAVANRQLRIAAQALARIEHERYIEFFATHPQASRAFVIAVAGYCPCSEDFVDRYANLRDWDWWALSANEALPWSASLIGRYEARWNWGSLSHNSALPWNDALIDEFAGRWLWGGWGLSENGALPWSESLIQRYGDRLDLGGLSGIEELPWSDALIECYADRWNWGTLSWNHTLPWSETLIERYATRWDWYWLSMNAALPWSEALINHYQGHWNWSGLSSNRALPWSEALIERFRTRWYWGRGGLSSNSALPWSEALIERYADRWDWSSISQSQLWNTELIQRYVDQLDWSALSGNHTLPWCDELIERYAERWAWSNLSSNDALPWSAALIERYADRSDWQRLSWNRGLLWSEALIERYADRWDWTRAPETALRILLPRWSEESIRAVMDRIASLQVYSRPINGEPLDKAFNEEKYAQARRLFVPITCSLSPHLKEPENQIIEKLRALRDQCPDEPPDLRKLPPYIKRLIVDLESEPHHRDGPGMSVETHHSPTIDLLVAMSKYLSSNESEFARMLYRFGAWLIDVCEFDKSGIESIQRDILDFMKTHRLHAAHSDVFGLLDVLQDKDAEAEFSEERYNEAKDHFRSAARHFAEAIDDFDDVISRLLVDLREQFAWQCSDVEGLIPYLLRFTRDIESKAIDIWDPEFFTPDH